MYIYVWFLLAEREIERKKENASTAFPLDSSRYTEKRPLGFIFSFSALLGLAHGKYSGMARYNANMEFLVCAKVEREYKVIRSVLVLIIILRLFCQIV